LGSLLAVGFTAAGVAAGLAAGAAGLTAAAAGFGAAAGFAAAGFVSVAGAAAGLAAAGLGAAAGAVDALAGFGFGFAGVEGCCVAGGVVGVCARAPAGKAASKATVVALTAEKMRNGVIGACSQLRRKYWLTLERQLAIGPSGKLGNRQCKGGAGCELPQGARVSFSNASARKV
jgi:hypothetical protein